MAIVLENSFVLIESISYRAPFTLLHSEWPKLDGVLAILSAVGLMHVIILMRADFNPFMIL